MKRPTIIGLLTALPLMGSIVLAQTGDWQAVQHLPGGTMLKITLKHGHTFGHCEFMGATDHALHCDYPGCSTFERNIPATMSKRCTWFTILEPSGLELERAQEQ